MKIFLRSFALATVCLSIALLISASPMAETANAKIRKPDLEIAPPQEERPLTLTEVIAKYGKEGLHKYRLPIPKNAGNGVPMSPERMYEMAEMVRKKREQHEQLRK